VWDSSLSNALFSFFNFLSDARKEIFPKILIFPLFSLASLLWDVVRNDNGNDMGMIFTFAWLFSLKDNP
jgi:hypothetical protein